ncbi:uncharacterized protein L3040_006916 [Drepanopeziza brunnea f. sp. 'multigermtubi']|uniref:uncharacterized protein n=1 Tax=Drepanopeziza brunnea f. sp. 'multigermtubi' TaxID=698441 RepID=UPI0023946BB2|nr:hypothetical protein L3040_006916 [Drepanopeziza brunnea f. sp. 'multigermtubi']
MLSFMKILYSPSVLMMIAIANAQGVIQTAQGTMGSPASLPLAIELQAADANIINLEEITANVVNECGRTLLGGNIDVGENTENQLIAKTVTSVTKGGTVNVAVNRVDANGAGPYTCDLDLKGNANGFNGQKYLTVKESAPSNGIINLTVTMPADMACIGASTGNVCTMRCFNTAAAGPFGGCVALQQTDTEASDNSPNQINTAQTLAGILAQVNQNQVDLAKAEAGNAAATKVTDQGVIIADNLLGIDSKALATAAAAATGVDAVATNTANTGKSGKSGKSGKGNKKAGSGTNRGHRGHNNQRSAKLFIS